MIAARTAHTKAWKTPACPPARPFLLPSSQSLISTRRSLSEFCYRRSVLSSGFYVTGTEQGVLFWVWLLPPRMLSASLLRATACVIRKSLSSSGSGVPWCGCRGPLVHSSPCTELFLLNSDVSGFCFTVCPFYVLLKNLPHLELRKFFFFLLRCLLKVWVLALSILILIKKQLKGGY